MAIESGRSDVGIIGPIHRTECSLAGKAALQMLSRFLGRRSFNWIGATAEPESSRDETSGRNGFQALTLIRTPPVGKNEKRCGKKVTSDIDFAG